MKAKVGDVVKIKYFDHVSVDGISDEEVHEKTITTLTAYGKLLGYDKFCTKIAVQEDESKLNNHVYFILTRCIDGEPEVLK